MEVGQRVAKHSQTILCIVIKASSDGGLVSNPPILTAHVLFTNHRYLLALWVHVLDLVHKRWHTNSLLAVFRVHC